jgi:hypothetical protein
MPKKLARGVLASFRGATSRSVRLASSLAAALPEGLFEYPRGISPLASDVRAIEALLCGMVFPKFLRRRAALLNRLEALGHPVPYETVQPEICGPFHLDEFNPCQVAMHPSHVGFIDRQ